VDSIRQVDVELNFLLVLLFQSTGYMSGKFFGWAEHIGCPPNLIVGWATAHPAPIGSRAFGLRCDRIMVMSLWPLFWPTLYTNGYINRPFTSHYLEPSTVEKV